MFTVIALVALVASRADARLWESVAQTEARYGPTLQKFPGDAPGEEDRKYRYKDYPKLPRSTIPGLGIYTLARAKKLIKLP